MITKNVFVWVLGIGAMAASVYGGECTQYTDCVTCANDTECYWVSGVDCTQFCLRKEQEDYATRNNITDPTKCGDSSFSCTLVGPPKEGIGEGIRDPSFESGELFLEKRRYKLEEWIEERRLGARHKDLDSGDNVLMYPVDGNSYMYFGGHKYDPSAYTAPEPKNFYQYQLRQKKVIIPNNVTHLSFFMRVPNVNSEDKFSLTILIDRLPVFSFTEKNIGKYINTDTYTVANNRYIEVDIRDIVKKISSKSVNEHSFVMNYMIYFSNINSQETPNGVGIDYIHFINSNHIGDMNVFNVSDSSSTCSRWCPDDFQSQYGTCRLGCIKCYPKFNEYCAFFKDTDEPYLTTKIIIIIVVAVVVVAVILTLIAVFVALKVRKKRNTARAASVNAYDAKAEEVNDDWGFNKQSLSFNQNDDEFNDGGTVLKDMVILNNKDYSSITVTFKTPKNDKYEIMLKESKYTVKKGDSVKIKVMLRLYCSVNISDNIIAEVKGI